MSQNPESRKQTKKLRVVLADNLGLILEGIRGVLRVADDVEIVGETSDPAEAVLLAGKLKPDVVLLDQDLGDREGLQVCLRIKEAAPDVEVIVMTDELDDAKALQAIEARATGYILKDIPGINLATAVRAVCNARGFFHPAITRKLMDRLGNLTREREAHRLRSGGLTPRELDILIEVAKGQTDLEIAVQLTVSEGTIKTHIRHILRKLRAKNRAHAVAYVLRKGFIR